ncbi:hypothetical protein ACFS4T_04115 [Pseudomonas lini]
MLPLHRRLSASSRVPCVWPVATRLCGIFPVPYSDPLKPVYTTAQYDRNEDRFLFVRGLDPAYQKVACLGAIVDKYAYYYVPDDVLIWRTDVTTGQVNRIYRLMDPVPGSRISAFQELEGGLMRIVQKVVLRNGRDMKMTYLLGANDLSLFFCHRRSDRGPEGIAATQEHGLPCVFLLGLRIDGAQFEARAFRCRECRGLSMRSPDLNHLLARGFSQPHQPLVATG